MYSRDQNSSPHADFFCTEMAISRLTIINIDQSHNSQNKKTIIFKNYFGTHGRVFFGKC